MANVTYIAPVKAESTIHKIRCAAYCRVSSSSEDQLHSYAAQVRFYSEKFNGSETEELVDIYADEGITGTSNEKRNEFKRLINDCKRGKIDRIYTKSISRFARNTKDCLNTVRLLKELGITIIFEEDNIDSAKIHDEFMITVMGSLAQEESTSISQNMRWSVKKRMENGTFEPSSVPYGYIKKDGKLVVEPTDAKIVKMIYDWYLSGMGLSKIANELNNRGVPPIIRGSKWYTFPVKYILKNERYVGDMLLQKYYSSDTLPYKKIANKGERDKYLISDSHEAIISRDDFNKVQRLFAEREKKYYNGNRNKSVFSSVIKCGNCRASFKRKIDKGKYYWVCRNHDEDYDSCSLKQIPEKLIKEKFLCMLNKLILHYREILLPLQRSLMEVNTRGFNGNTKILGIRKDMAELKEQRHIISRLRKRGFLDDKKYNEKLTELESKMTRLDRELKKHTKNDTADETIKQLDNLIDCIDSQSSIITDFDEELFGMIVEKVIINEKTMEFCLISGITFKENIYFD